MAVGERNFAIMQRYVEDVLTVPDDALLHAIWLLASRAKLVVEPTGALAAAALISGALPPRGRTAVVLSGGNISPDVLAQAAAAG